MSARTIARKAARVALPAAAAIGIVASGGGANAQTLSQDTNYFYGVASAGDCSVTSALAKATQFAGKVSAWGYTGCSYVHNDLTITTTLKANNGVTSWTVGSTQPYTVMGSRSVGWVQTLKFTCNPNYGYQTVTQTNVSGIGSFYSTTGAPRHVC